MTWAIAELLAEHAGRVTVSNPMRTRAIASAKVKTDKIDAKVLAQLGAADFLPEVWAPDEITRALRRRIAHRSSLVRQRTRLRNQIHAVLARNLIEAPFTDVFGQGGRQWLAEVQLPAHEREQVDSNLRLHDALDVEIELAERSSPSRRSRRPDVRRLMTIPGVGAITALALVAVIGDVSRFPSARHLVGYLGLDPRVRQSGEKAGPPRAHLPRRGRRTRAGCWSRRRTPRSAPRARCARSTPGSRHGAASRSRSARPPASSRSSPGICSPRTRTTVRCADDHAAQAPHAATQGRRQRPEDQPRRRDQAQEARAAVPRRSRAQLPELRRVQSTQNRGAGAANGDATVNGRQSGKRCAAGSTVPRRLLFSFGVTRATGDSCTQPLTFSSVFAGRDRRTMVRRGEPLSRIGRGRPGGAGCS